jgi:hypothetical protein
MMQVITIDELSILNPMLGRGTTEYKKLTKRIERSRKDAGKNWRSYSHPDDKRKILIDYNTIPAGFKDEYALPLEYKDARGTITERLKAIETTNKPTANNADNYLIRKELLHIQESMFLKFMPIYAATTGNNSKLAENKAREHALRLAVVQLRDIPGIKINELHQAYLSLSSTGTQNNYYKFSDLIRNKWTTSEGVNLMHGHAGKERTDLKKFTEWHIAIIEELYKHPNQYSHNLITEMLNRECKKEGKPEICRRSVSKYLQQPEVYNRLLIFRNKEAFGKKVQPIMRRTKAMYAGDLYYMDGSPLQINCWNREHKTIIRPTLYVVLDSYSGKITGFHIAETEDRYTVLAAMKMAFSIENLLPAEVVYDNASATGTTEFLQLKDKLLLKGCLLRAAKPGQPTAKAQVERWFGSFQSEYQRLIEGFIGEGIRSSRETGRIDAEFLKKVVKQNGHYTFDAMVQIVARLIAIYNQKATTTKTAPSVAFSTSEKPSAHALTPEQMALLFWNYRPIKVSRSEVKLTVRRNIYYYGVTDRSQQMSLNGQMVKVYYDETDLSRVHIFNDNDEYLCELEQKFMPHEAQANQTEKDVHHIMGQSSHKKAVARNLLKDGKDRTDKAREIVGDNMNKILNPFETLKEEFNTAETELLLEVAGLSHSIDRREEPTHKPVGAQTENMTTRHSKRHQVTPKEIVIVDRI